jgi:predicted metalloprotease with PDZ domain
VQRLYVIVALLLLSSASVGQCALHNPHSSDVLRYSFEPLIAADRMRLLVTLEFQGGVSGKAKLELPSEWAGQKQVEKSITQLRVLSDGTTITDTALPFEKELRFSSGATVRVSYILEKDWHGGLDRETRFRVDLSPNYFHIIGITSLVHPKINDSCMVTVDFDWQRLPIGWSLATSFGTDDRRQSFHGPWREAVNSLFVGGDYRIYRTEISGNILDFAIRGKWNFTDEEWVSDVSKIIEFERTFWHDSGFPYFLVTLTPFDQDHGSTGGTALTNAFMMHLSRLDGLTTSILETLAHEAFHGWNPLRIGTRQGSGYEVSWFSEGFTHYFQDVILFRAGLLSFPQYVTEAGKNVGDYYVKEGANVSLRDFVRLHSADTAVLDQLDDRRGAVIATWLDPTIRRDSGNKESLDNLMFDLVNQNANYQHTHNDKPMALTNKRIFRMASKYIGRDSEKQLRKYVERGGEIPMPENALGPCVHSNVEKTSKFDLGFDRRSVKSEDKIVFGVEADSEAWKAGLRDGQRLVGWSIHNGDASKEVRLTIQTADGELVLRYYPRGSDISIQRFTLDARDYSSHPELCTAELHSSP